MKAKKQLDQVAQLRALITQECTKEAPSDSLLQCYVSALSERQREDRIASIGSGPGGPVHAEFLDDAFGGTFAPSRGMDPFTTQILAMVENLLPNVMPNPKHVKLNGLLARLPELQLLYGTEKLEFIKLRLREHVDEILAETETPAVAAPPEAS